MAATRDRSVPLYPAVAETIALLDLEPEDAALVDLARHYAVAIDEAVTAAEARYATRWLGPELHKVLESLGASPAARARLKGARPPVELDNPVRQLRTVAL